MPFDVVVFDLDGTLLDTYEDIADSLNAALAELGRPALPSDLVKYYIGGGVEALIGRALGPDATPETSATCTARFREEYSRRWACKTHPFHGVQQLLDALAERRVRMAVLSNKPDRATRDCVARFFPAERFEVVAGAQPGIPRKPDPTGARLVAQQLHARPDEILYLGDTAADMQTAVAAGMYPVGVTWGYRPSEELQAHGAAKLIDQPQDLLGLLE